MPLVVVRLIIAKSVAEYLILDRGGVRARKFHAPRLAIGLAPSKFFSIRSSSAKTLDVGRIILEVGGTRRPIRHSEVGCCAFESRPMDRHVHQMGARLLKAK